MFSSLAIPLHGLGIVFLHTFAFGMHQPEIGLRYDVSLFSSLAIPLHGLGIVFLHAFTIGIHESEIVLR